MTGVGRKHYGEILFEIKTLVEEGKIKPLLHEEIFNWRDVSQAHRLFENGGQKGKVVLVVE